MVENKSEKKIERILADAKPLVGLDEGSDYLEGERNEGLKQRPYELSSVPSYIDSPGT